MILSRPRGFRVGRPCNAILSISSGPDPVPKAGLSPRLRGWDSRDSRAPASGVCDYRPKVHRASKPRETAAALFTGHFRSSGKQPSSLTHPAWGGRFFASARRSRGEAAVDRARRAVRTDLDQSVCAPCGGTRDRSHSTSQRQGAFRMRLERDERRTRVDKSLFRSPRLADRQTSPTLDRVGCNTDLC